MIDHGEVQAPGLGSCADAGWRPGRAGTHRVGDQVGDDAFEQAWVGVGERQVGGNVDLDERGGWQVAQRSGDDVVQGGGLSVDAEGAGL